MDQLVTWRTNALRDSGLRIDDGWPTGGDWIVVWLVAVHAVLCISAQASTN
jgi:hypothetical protein